MARRMIIRLLLSAAALVAWFWTQSLIGHRAMPASEIGDRLLDWTSPINLYLYEHGNVANGLLIASSGIIGLLGATELARFGKLWLTGAAVLLAVFEMLTVLVLRAHYTMDVFT